MGIFNTKPIKRLNEDGLRDIYIESKKADKFTCIFFMVVSGLSSIAVISYAIIEKIYWVLSFSILLIILFIYCINKFSPELAKELFTGYEPRFIEETEREISNLKNARETQVDRDYNFESWESKQDQELSLL